MIMVSKFVTPLIGFYNAIINNECNDNHDDNFENGGGNGDDDEFLPYHKSFQQNIYSSEETDKASMLMHVIYIAFLM